MLARELSQQYYLNVLDSFSFTSLGPVLLPAMPPELLVVLVEPPESKAHTNTSKDIP